MVGRKPNLGVYSVATPPPRALLGIIGIPLSRPAGSPGDTAGVALMPAPGNAEPTWLNAGAAAAQLCGTERVPSEAARPKPAVIWALPTPEPKAPFPELKPSPKVKLNIRIWLARTADLGPRDPPSEPAEPIAERPRVDIDVAEPAPDARPMPEVNAVDDGVTIDNNDSGDADGEDDIEEAIEASSASASGATTVVSGVDIAVVNGATVCAPVPTAALTAWATASDCAATPAGLVVCAGTVNGLSTEAACAAA